MTPEQRIAADLGLDMADLERIVRAERARRLAPRLHNVVRELAGAVAEAVACDDPSALGSIVAGPMDDASAILARIDAPVSPPLVKLGPGGDFVRVWKT